MGIFSNVKAEINGYELTFNPQLDGRRIVAKEHTTVSMRLSGASGLNPVIYVDGEPLGYPIRVEAQLTEWEWLAEATAGYYDIEIDLGQVQLKSRLQVIPSKITTEQYERMLTEVDKVATALRFDFLGIGHELTEFRTCGHRDLPGEFRLLSDLSDAFLLAVPIVLATPTSNLRQSRDQDRLRTVRWPASEWTSIMRVIATGQESANAPAMTTLLGPGLVDDVRTAENAYIKAFMVTLVDRWVVLKSQLATAIERRVFIETTMRKKRISRELGVMRARAEFYINRIRDIANGSWLRGIIPGPMLPTFRMTRLPGYRTIHALASRLTLTEEVVTMAMPKSQHRHGIKPVDDIYEIWSLFAIADALRGLGAVVEPPSPLMLQSVKGLRPQLRDNSRMLFLWDGGEGDIVWKPKIKKLTALNHYYRYTNVELAPDLILEVRPASGSPRGLILDAKYRRSSDGRPCPGDLEKALRYFDEIVAPEGVEKTYSCILFPGDKWAELREAKAIPVAPNHGEALRGFLAQVLAL